MSTERFLDVGHVRLRVVEDGLATDTSAFVLVHGLGGSATRFNDLMPHLARIRRTIAMDLPGFGYSDTPNGSYSMAWFAGAVRATMDAAGIERAVLLGNSMGGVVAMHLAAAEPQRIDALVLSAPALPILGRPDREVLAGFVAPMVPVLGPKLYMRYVRQRSAETLVKELLQRNVADPSKVAPETVAKMVVETRATAFHEDRGRAIERTNRALGWAMSGGRETTWAVARAVRAPTLVIWGAQDSMLPSALGEAAVREIPGSQLVVLDGLGHIPFLEAPERFARAVQTFIGESPRLGVHGQG